MVRKIITIISLLSFIVFCSISIMNKQEHTQNVFNKVDQYYYDLYMVNVSKENVNTKNLLDYFEGIDILKIYPNNNPIYSKFIKINEYKFDNVLSVKKNISNFTNVYNSRLKENALIKEVEMFNVSGIKLNSIKIYASEEQVNKLKELLPKIEINSINN